MNREGRMAADANWQTKEIGDLLEAILRLDSVDEAGKFFRDLCTLGELHDMSQRWAVARLLDQGLHYAQISQETGASTATITRIASWLNHGEGGYRLMLDRGRNNRSGRRRKIRAAAPGGSQRPS
jgi:TrpR-related protein YerC/YecD